MAAHGNNKYIRLRLSFDYPPPAAVGCRMCWLLVDVATCRVVADLESMIREKFEFSRSSVLSLFVEDCYLPHTESVYVVRDNDTVRVKVECVAQLNGHGSCPETANAKRRKRRRDAGEDAPANGPIIEHKKKKKKKKFDSGTEHQPVLATLENNNKTPQTKKKKKKKRAVKSVDDTRAAVPMATASSHKPPRPKKTPVGKTKKPKAPSSDSSSRSSDEDEACHRKVAKKPGITPAASKEPLKPKAILKKPEQPQPSSWLDTDSSSDEASSSKVPAKAKAPPPVSPGSTAPRGQSALCAQEQPAPHTHAQDDVQLVIRRPQQPVLNIPGHKRWAGAGGGESSGGRARGDEPAQHTAALLSTSGPLQSEAEPVPQKDYSSMPLLAGPPQVGQKIAFKLLELTENYTPEVSEYKEGKIVNFDPTTKQIELELLNASQAPAEPGKFDLVYQNPDGSESVEYAVQRGSSVMERWESLLEPRLII